MKNTFQKAVPLTELFSFKVYCVNVADLSKIIGQSFKFGPPAGYTWELYSSSPSHWKLWSLKGKYHNPVGS